MSTKLTIANHWQGNSWIPVLLKQSWPVADVQKEIVNDHKESGRS
jgi:hypothetical protein